MIVSGQYGGLPCIVTLVVMTMSTVRAEPKDYELRIVPPSALHVGDSKALSLTIQARGNYTISKVGPLEVIATAAPEGLQLRRTRFLRKHAADARARNPRFDIGLRGNKAGRYQLTLRSRFWVCLRRTCRPVRQTRRVGIEVLVRQPPADAGASTPVP